MTDRARPGRGWNALGAAGIAFYAVHAGQYLLRREPENLLWACHLGTLAVGIGLLARAATPTAVGTTWLLVGLPLWLYDLAAGGEFLPTTLLTHVGGLVLGLVGLKGLGLPGGTWWKSVAGLVPVYAVSRLVSTEEGNVNLSRHVYPGFESAFPSYPLYVAALAALYAGAGAVLQAGLRRLGFGPPREA